MMHVIPNVNSLNSRYAPLLISFHNFVVTPEQQPYYFLIYSEEMMLKTFYHLLNFLFILITCPTHTPHASFPRSISYAQ